MLTIQVPQICLSCPLTFVVVNDVEPDVVLGADWFHRTNMDVSHCFPPYHDGGPYPNDYALPVHADSSHHISSQSLPADPLIVADKTVFLEVHCMMRHQLINVGN